MDNPVHRLPLKTRLIFVGVLVTVQIVGNTIYIKNGLKKIKADSEQEIAVMDKARQIVMDKALRGEYEGSTVEQMLSDYEFYKMAEREKNSK